MLLRAGPASRARVQGAGFRFTNAGIFWRAPFLATSIRQLGACWIATGTCCPSALTSHDTWPFTKRSSPRLPKNAVSCMTKWHRSWWRRASTCPNAKVRGRAGYVWHHRTHLSTTYLHRGSVWVLCVRDFAPREGQRTVVIRVYSSLFTRVHLRNKRRSMFRKGDSTTQQTCQGMNTDLCSTPTSLCFGLSHTPRGALPHWFGCSKHGNCSSRKARPHSAHSPQSE